VLAGAKRIHNFILRNVHTRSHFNCTPFHYTKVMYFIFYSCAWRKWYLRYDVGKRDFPNLLEKRVGILLPYRYSLCDIPGGELLRLFSLYFDPAKIAFTVIEHFRVVRIFLFTLIGGGIEKKK